VKLGVRVGKKSRNGVLTFERIEPEEKTNKVKRKMKNLKGVLRKV